MVPRTPISTLIDTRLAYTTLFRAGDDAVLVVVAVRHPVVLLGGYVAEHLGAVPADHRRADRAGDVVVARRDVGRQRAERVERRLVADLQLEIGRAHV